jgi:hypothetical protein
MGNEINNCGSFGLYRVSFSFLLSVIWCKSFFVSELLSFKT